MEEAQVIFVENSGYILPFRPFRVILVASFLCVSATRTCQSDEPCHVKRITLKKIGTEVINDTLRKVSKIARTALWSGPVFPIGS